MVMANVVGRPKLFNSADELQKVIDEYFDWCDNRIQQVYSKKQDCVIEINNPAPYTMAGLARRIGMDRKTLFNYSKDKDFFPTIKAARDRVQEDVEIRLMETAATGAIFNLKNNFGYVDKTETDVTTNGNDITNPVDANMLTQFLMNVQDGTKR